MYEALPLLLQAVPRLRPLVGGLFLTMARFQSEAGPSGICSGQSDTDVGSSSSMSINVQQDATIHNLFYL